ncbi:MAG: hypothetical protein KGL95_10855, partial [Patescibacteria group bacterium]|nr:hypothetical protein [Patescibacteria group bacterium]
MRAHLDGQYSRAHPRGERPVPTRLERAIAYLDRAGPKLLGEDEQTILRKNYSHGLREAMKGNKTHLNIADTLIDPQRIIEGRFPPNKTIWFIEIGGTNLRGGIMKTNAAGKPELVSQPGHETRPAYMEIELPKTKFSSVGEFAQVVAEELSNVFEEPITPGSDTKATHKKALTPDALAIIFSFSGDPVHTADHGRKRKNIDVTFGHHNVGAIAAKGFEFPDIHHEGVYVGQTIRQAFEQRFNIPNSLP